MNERIQANLVNKARIRALASARETTDVVMRHLSSPIGRLSCRPDVCRVRRGRGRAARHACQRGRARARQRGPGDAARRQSRLMSPMKTRRSSRLKRAARAGLLLVSIDHDDVCRVSRARQRSAKAKSPRTGSVGGSTARLHRPLTSSARGRAPRRRARPRCVSSCAS